MSAGLVLERRVVLDANYLRGAPVALLGALRDRGFRLSVSMGPLLEVLARAMRENRIDAFKRRFAAIAPLMDPVEPVNPTGLSLLGMIGGYLIEGVRLEPHVEAVHRLRSTWRELATGVDDATWRELAQYGDQTIDEVAKGMFDGAIEELRPLVDDLRGDDERDRIDELTDRLMSYLEGQIWVPEGLRQRFDLFVRTWALLTVRQNSSGPGNLNDAEDLALLLNVGLPAFVATRDIRLIGRADATGSVQALWVRTASELLLLDFDDLPVGAPWGSTASEQVVTCARGESLDEIRKREEALIERLTRSTSRPESAA